MSNKKPWQTLRIPIVLCIIAAAVDMYFDTLFASPLAWALSAFVVYRNDAPRADD